jgi:hypothetical protein
MQGSFDCAQDDSNRGSIPRTGFPRPHRREIGTGLVSFACGANVPVPGFSSLYCVYIPFEFAQGRLCSRHLFPNAPALII